jgi:hypothetical protein
VKHGDFEISHVVREIKLANIFMMPFDEARFKELRHELNIINSSNVS